MIGGRQSHEGTYATVVSLASSLERTNQFHSGIMYRVAARLAFGREEFDRSREFSLKAMSIFEQLARSEPDNSTAYLESAGMAAKDAGETSRARELMTEKFAGFRQMIRQLGDQIDESEGVSGMIDGFGRSRNLDLQVGTEGVYPRSRTEAILIDFKNNIDAFVLYTSAEMLLRKYGYPDSASEMGKRARELETAGIAGGRRG